MKRIFTIFAMFAALSLVAPAQSTHSSATLTQVVTGAPPIAASIVFTSTPNPGVVGKAIVYNGVVSGANNGAKPTGTVTVAGITGSQTVTIGADGTFTCSETPTAPTTGFRVVATYNGDSNFF